MVLVLVAGTVSCGLFGRDRVAVLGDSITTYASQPLHASLDDGYSTDIGGYYVANPAKAGAVMRPSATFNAVIDPLAA